jgi:aryl-alcohol dehydrogenase-like predicted oxidoreductase
LQQEGKIRHLALTNFDTERLRIITEAGIRIVSNQVQYSVIDQRPELKMAAFCQQHGITLLTYGTLGGGLLSSRYLNQPEPSPAQLPTASLRKYKNMVDAWGSWKLFQELLMALQQVAEGHGSSIPLVATRFILDQPAVAGVIIGTRLGLQDHHVENARVFDLHLTPDDHSAIAAVTSRARDLMQVIGDCGDEYRR